jgi:hypothetical protein
MESMGVQSKGAFEELRSLFVFPWWAASNFAAPWLGVGLAAWLMSRSKHRVQRRSIEPPPNLLRYVLRTLGPGGGVKLVRNLFFRPFTAPTLRTFWKYWNPVYGYFLTFYVYRPLRLRMPPNAAMPITFAFSGFVLHDLVNWALLGGSVPFPRVTVAFLLVAALILVTEKLGVTFVNLPSTFRVIAHISSLSACFAVSYLLARAFA